MARPRKQGLGYFPFDCDFFSDERMVAIAGEFGLKGEIITVKLLCAVYRNGYFAEWGELMKFKLLKELPGVSVEMLDAVVSRLVRWGFFNEELFSSVGVLTSEEIQRTYFGITRGRMQTEGLPYLLGFLHRNPSLKGVSTSETSFCVRNSSETGVSYEETGVSYKKTPQIKGKEIKETNFVGKERAAQTPPPPPTDKGSLNAESSFKKNPGAVDYRKPVAELTAICKAEAGYLDSVLLTLERENIRRGRDAVLAELDYFQVHLTNIGKNEPRRLQDFKAHFMSYLRKKWTATKPAEVLRTQDKPDYGSIQSQI